MDEHETKADAEENERRLQELASRAGTAWASAVREHLRTEGRPPAGMWPGTMSEARSLAIGFLRDLASEPSAQDLRERVTKIVYASARARWRTWSTPEDPDAT